MIIENMTELHLKPVPKDYPAKHLGKNTDKMMLVQDFIVKITLDDNQEIVICVPEGYVSDGASIPRFFHRLFHPFETESFWAAIVHDYLYSHLYFKFPKEFADEVLKEMILRDGGSWFMANAFYRAVRLNVSGGGWK